MLTTAIQCALIADDHSLYRSGLTLLLQDTFAIPTVGEVATFDEALDWLNERPETTLALFDLAMPGMDGPKSLRVIRELYPHIKIAIVTASEAAHDVEIAMAEGICGYISKKTPSDQFAAAIEAVIEGHSYIENFKKLNARDEEGLAQPTDENGGNKSLKMMAQRGLSDVQNMILDGLTAGLSNHEIGEKIGISIDQVKHQIRVLMKAAGVRNRIALALTYRHEPSQR